MILMIPERRCNVSNSYEMVHLLTQTPCVKGLLSAAAYARSNAVTRCIKTTVLKKLLFEINVL